MSSFYDSLETRSTDERAAWLATALPEQVARARALSGYAATLADVDPGSITGAEALATLPVLRKSDLGAAQQVAAPSAVSRRAPPMASPTSSRAPVRSTNPAGWSMTGGAWAGSCMPVASGKATSCRTALATT